MMLATASFSLFQCGIMPSFKNPLPPPPQLPESENSIIHCAHERNVSIVWHSVAANVATQMALSSACTNAPHKVLGVALPPEPSECQAEALI
eukprot:6473699-Amphidinium_carterae.1